MDDLHTIEPADIEPMSHDLMGSVDDRGQTQREKALLPNHAGPLPTGYIAQDDGIYYLREDENGDLQPEWLCSPLALIGTCRRSDGKGWGRVVDVSDLDGRLHR